MNVAVTQQKYGGYVAAREEATLPEVACAFYVSEATVRRHLDGLVAQGLLEVVPGKTGRNPRSRVYRVPRRDTA